MATAKKAKKLTSTIVSRQTKALDEQLDVKVYSAVTGDEYELKIDKVFRKSKVLKINAEILSAIQYAEMHNVDFELFLPQYSLILILKYFTSLGDSMTDNITKQVELLSSLDDLGLLEPIIDEMPDGQLEYAFELMEKTIFEMNNNLIKQQEKLAELEKEMAEVSELVSQD